MKDEIYLYIINVFSVIFILLICSAVGASYADINWKKDITKVTKDSNHSILAFNFNNSIHYYHIEEVKLNNYKNFSLEKNTENNKTEIDNLLYNGIYEWFCYDSSSYEPAISDLSKSYLDRKCELISIDNSSVNRSYYIENGWD